MSNFGIVALIIVALLVGIGLGAVGMSYFERDAVDNAPFGDVMGARDEENLAERCEEWFRDQQAELQELRDQVSVERSNIANGVRMELMSENQELLQDLESQVRDQVNDQTEISINVVNRSPNAITIEITSTDPEIVTNIQDQLGDSGESQGANQFENMNQ